MVYLEYKLFKSQSVDFRIHVYPLLNSSDTWEIKLISWFSDVVSGSRFFIEHGIEEEKIICSRDNWNLIENAIRDHIGKWLIHEFEEFLTYDDKCLWNPHSWNPFEENRQLFDKILIINNIFNFDPLKFNFYRTCPLNIKITDKSYLLEVRIGEYLFEISKLIFYMYSQNLTEKFTLMKNILLQFWMTYHRSLWTWPVIEKITSDIRSMY
jgi:hypothetical protein